VPYLQQLLATWSAPRPQELALELGSDGDASADDSGDDGRAPVRVFVQLRTRKTAEVRVAPGASVRALYAKVAALLGQRSESFVLELPGQPLTEPHARIARVVRDGCVVRVTDR
jgi:hypothetical protein